MTTLILATASSYAGTVIIKLELPPAPPHPDLKVKGFLDRVDNPITSPRKVAVAPQIVVVLEGAEPRTDATGQVPWLLVGESFEKPLIGVPAGSEVVIKNVSKTARNLIAVEDPKLVPAGPINPTGPKSFRVTEARTYTITDKDASHLKGTILVVTTPHVSTLDTANRVEFENVPEGAYKARVFYKDGWIAEKPVNVPAKGKAEVAFDAAAMAASSAPTTAPKK